MGKGRDAIEAQSQLKIGEVGFVISVDNHPLWKVCGIAALIKTDVFTLGSNLTWAG